jgi:hypothetical protein
MPPYSPDRDNWSIEATERLFPPIAKQVFNTDPKNIIYAWNYPEIDRLDLDYGTDAILKTPRRNVALAIRIRGFYYFDRFGDITIRYDSLQTLGKELEIRKSIARFMFYGWGDTNSPGTRRDKIDPTTIRPPTKIVYWYVIWLQRLIDVYLRKDLRYTGPHPNGDKSSRLVGISVSELDRHGLIYRKMDQPTEEQDETWELSQMVWEQQRLFELNEAYRNEQHHAPWVYD